MCKKTPSKEQIQFLRNLGTVLYSWEPNDESAVKKAREAFTDLLSEGWLESESEKIDANRPDWRVPTGVGVLAAFFCIGLLIGQGWTARDSEFKVVFAIWTLVPPAWFLYEYSRTPLLYRSEITYSQGLASKCWAAVAALMAAMAFVSAPKVAKEIDITELSGHEVVFHNRTSWDYIVPVRNKGEQVNLVCGDRSLDAIQGITVVDVPAGSELKFKGESSSNTGSSQTFFSRPLAVMMAIIYGVPALTYMAVNKP